MYYYLYRNAAYKSRSMETIWQECPFWAGLSPPGGGFLHRMNVYLHSIFLEIGNTLVRNICCYR